MGKDQKHSLKLQFSPGKNKPYEVLETYTYFSERYGKHVTAKAGYKSDGASGAEDITSAGWVIHDVLCDFGVFDDGTPCSNLQASMILSDILASEGRHVRRFTWFLATFLFGGGEARKNGMFKAD